MTLKKPNGCVIWEGLSLVDSSPLVILLTGLEIPSANRKTGWMLQTYVLRQDILPTSAIATREDYSTCGDCPLRHKVCYVNMAPVNNVWRMYKQGQYPNIDGQILQQIEHRQQMLRITAYGDAASTPIEAWKPLLEKVRAWTGYTHQWRNCDSRWRNFLMASVESKADREQAKSLGWRTFRIVSNQDDLDKSEILCRHVHSEKIQCENCGLCDGGKGCDIADPVHGLNWKQENFNSQVESRKSQLKTIVQ